MSPPVHVAHAALPQHILDVVKSADHLADEPITHAFPLALAHSACADRRGSRWLSKRQEV
jgi:hypothetical protein